MAHRGQPQRCSNLSAIEVGADIGQHSALITHHTATGGHQSRNRLSVGVCVSLLAIRKHTRLKWLPAESNSAARCLFPSQSKSLRFISRLGKLPLVACEDWAKRNGMDTSQETPRRHRAGLLKRITSYGGQYGSSYDIEIN